ncbi:MAG TPA: hypothetical protein DDX91_09675, partial [Ruminococcaceae bacterium]|nr:hypothetical protein [Oscillospiraceae bacterium]
GHTKVVDPAVEATCTEAGKTEGSHCSACGTVIKAQETIPAKGHMEVIDPAVEATCTEEGKTEGSHCSVCGTVIIESKIIAALGHDWNEGRITKDPTCTEKGEKEFQCSRCNETKTEDIAENNHSFGDWQSDAERHWKLCTECNIKEFESEHQWDKGTVTVSPTEDSPGEKLYRCTVCGESRTEELPALGGDHKNGIITKDVRPGENAPKTEFETPLDELIEAVLTAEEREAVKNGMDIEIVLTVDDGTKFVSDEDRAKVEAAIDGINNCKLGQYLDINLFKILGGDQKRITETSALITIKFEVPEALRSENGKYSVIRVHNGEASVLSDLDDSLNTVTIQTDKFSTYALVYYEEVQSPVQSETPNGSDDNNDNSNDNDDNDDNLPTGYAVSLIPFTAAIIFTLTSFRRKEKK